MGILSTNTVSPDVAAANQVMSIAQQSFLNLARAGNLGFNLIWNNRNATPQAVIAALGTSASAVFQLANLNIETITSAATIGGVTVPNIPSVPQGYSLNFNSDGTCAVTYTSPTSSSSSSSSGSSGSTLS